MTARTTVSTRGRDYVVTALDGTVRFFDAATPDAAPIGELPAEFIADGYVLGRPYRLVRDRPDLTIGAITMAYIKGWVTGLDEPAHN